MLDQQTIETIKDTVPVLEKRGTEITTRFYEMMFQNHPELLNIFNHANQKQGRQQQALANAVYAAAQHIDDLETILPTVKQIAHKHRSLGVKPEQYPIVGENLLAAIKDVLGDAIDQDVLDAWKKAYGVIADVFITVEKDMYANAEKQPGGWKDFRNFIVTKKVKESDVITSFYLKPEDGKELATFLPGQYVSVKLAIPHETFTHIRQYSLSDAPGKPYYRISVKREKDGIVSNFLHDRIQEGDILPLSAPAGDFTLKTDNDLPVVLLSGGVGLTPLMSMFNTLVETEPERDVTFIQAAINSRVHAMRDHVEAVAKERKNIRAFICYDSPTERDRKNVCFDKEGYVDLPWLKQILPSNEAEFYFCGPIPFMKSILHALNEWGVPRERIHFEFFGPAMNLEQEPALVL